MKSRATSETINWSPPMEHCCSHWAMPQTDHDNFFHAATVKGKSMGVLQWGDRGTQRHRPQHSN